MTYRLASRLCAAAVALLAVLLLWAPWGVYALFDMARSPSADVICGRGAMLLLGLTCLMAMSAEHPPNRTRRAVAVSVAFALMALAVLGAFDWFRGVVGDGIWLAISVELVLGFLLLRAP